MNFKEFCDFFSNKKDILFYAQAKNSNIKNKYIAKKASFKPHLHNNFIFEELYSYNDFFGKEIDEPYSINMFVSISEKSLKNINEGDNELIVETSNGTFIFII